MLDFKVFAHSGRDYIGLPTAMAHVPYHCPHADMPGNATSNVRGIGQFIFIFNVCEECPTAPFIYSFFFRKHSLHNSNARSSL